MISRTRKIQFIIIGVAVVLLIGSRIWNSYVLYPHDDNSGSLSDYLIDNKVILITPHSNEIIKSPLIVSGQARGNWYFEASFPVKLLDANGAVIVSGPAHAKSDWMTTEFVPFEATLTFTEPATSKGWLVLEKDNPSGLPQNADSVKIPIRFE